MSLAGQVVHPLIHLPPSHLGQVSAVYFLPAHPVVPEAAPDGGEDPEGLRTRGGREGAGLLRRSRTRSLSLLEPGEGLEGLDVPDRERLVLETSGSGETVLPRGRLVEAGEG